MGQLLEGYGINLYLMKYINKIYQQLNYIGSIIIWLISENFVAECLRYLTHMNNVC
jgi:hypothetical protein